MKKLYALVLPVLAVAAFAVAPATALGTTAYGTCETATKAEEQHPPCGTLEKNFKAFPEGTTVNITTKGTTRFKLQTYEEPKPGEVVVKEEIECETLTDTGTVENVSGVGRSKENLVFSKCKVNTGALKGCKLSNITGNVSNQVTSATTVLISIVTETPPGFGVVIASGQAAPCTAGMSLGSVTGTATGTQAAGSNLIVFSNAIGLTFLSGKARITGTDAITETASGKKIYIN
ncbi:MAG TPA: hypothetical protein VIJ66_00270 [Solirubrobacteraceae bacterium]